VFPARLPETPPVPAKAGSAPPPASASTLAPPSEPSLEPSAAPAGGTEHGDLPDPDPLLQRAQWLYTVVYDKGDIHVRESEPLCLERARGTARKIGRFALELWLGRELIDRVRFDFPLLATEEPPAGPRRQTRETPRFAPGAVVTTTLWVPASERATSARILDRATGQSLVLPWPPQTSASTAVLRDCPRPPPRAQPPGQAPAAPKPSPAGR
jgi:hypothetical protein